MFGAILFFCFCISERNIINKVSLFDNGKNDSCHYFYGKIIGFLIYLMCMDKQLDKL